MGNERTVAHQGIRARDGSRRGDRQGRLSKMDRNGVLAFHACAANNKIRVSMGRELGEKTCWMIAQRFCRRRISNAFRYWLSGCFQSRSFGLTRSSTISSSFWWHR